MTTEQFTLLRALYFHLIRVRFHYDLYMHKQIYIRAKVIERANKDVMKIISSLILTGAIADDLKEILFSLVVHYDHWFVQFEIAEDKLKPQSDSTFIFTRDDDIPAFPSQLLDRLIDKTLKSHR